MSVCFHLYLTAALVSFEKRSYVVDENSGNVRLSLVLSNPSSTVITVQVFSTDGSATGKKLTISCTILE